MAGHEPDPRLRPLEEADALRLHSGFAAMGWSKPESLFRRYLAEQDEGARRLWVAEVEGAPVGYVTVLWRSADPVFREEGIPEIEDLNVLEGWRGRGLGRALLARAEAVAAERAEVVGLRVGLHEGYGRAQRLYARAGYLPDGRGALRDGRALPEGARVVLDDDVTLRMTKRLR